MQAKLPFPHTSRQRSAVEAILRKSTTPQGVALRAKIVLGLYMDAPEGAIVLSVDEKTQIQALDHTQPLLQLHPGSNDTVCGARRSMPWESCGNTFGGSS